MKTRTEIKKILAKNSAPKDEIIIELLLDIRHLLNVNTWGLKAEDV